MARGIQVGDDAPDFTLPSQSGELVRLKDRLGERVVVLYFYPKDDTPGCTTEACEFTEGIEAFRDLLKQELTALGGAKRQTEIQSFVPEPDYVSTSLPELVARLVRTPSNAAELPRFLDSLAYDFILRGVTPAASALVKYFGMGHDLHTIAKLAGNVVTLFGDQTGLDVTEFGEAAKVT